MIVKVKEPQAVERAMLRPEHVLYTYLHLAPDPVQTQGLIKSGCTVLVENGVLRTYQAPFHPWWSVAVTRSRTKKSD